MRQYWVVRLCWSSNERTGELYEEISMAIKTKHLHPDEPLYHRDHSRPVTRRELFKQGFISGSGLVLGSGLMNVLGSSQSHAALSPDIESFVAQMNSNYTDPICDISGTGNSSMPFICFDLGGGANFAGSNVLVGTDGQMSALSERGYSRLGLPPGMIPGASSENLAVATETAGQITGDVLNGPRLDGLTTDYVNDELGLLFHQDSPMLRGILEKFTSRAPGNIDGAVIPARSDNDTGNNTHNPLYGIAKAGALGSVVTLIGSQNSVSGGRSMSPPDLIDPEIRPTKVDRPSDVTGMIDVGDLTGVLNRNDVKAVMESMARVSHKKLSMVDSQLANDLLVKDLVRCGYIKAASIAERFAGQVVDPAQDPNIVGASGIFSAAEFMGSGEFRKTSSVMKMVLDGAPLTHAGAGCISMGGYDYHTGDRSTGENRDLRAGRCIGACLEYAAIKGQKLMVYVFSDGSLSSNGALDGSAPTGNNALGGRGKGEWTGDNSSTACSFFLVFDPSGGISFHTGNDLPDPRQIGRFTADGAVVTSATPAANNVNLLVNTVIANYMSLNGTLGDFVNRFPNHGLGDNNAIDDMVAFDPL